MEFLRRLQEQLRQIWAGMTPARRLLVLGVTALTLVLLGSVLFFALRAEFRVLYANLTPEDAAAVVRRLQELNVSYRVEAGGSTVLVPADQVERLRVQLAGEGLPAHPGKGFELFDESPLGMTPFTQHVNYLRALQAELARTIMQIEPIAFARVHITRTEPSPFVREQKPTTASVVLRLKPGRTLNRSTAAGIVALVSKAVEGLTPENVTLVDAQGRLLSEPPFPESGLVATQLEYRRNLENYLTTKAEAMLTQVLGPGRAIVRVAADINFQRLRERKETYDPTSKAITSEKTSSSKTTTTGAAPRGPAGTATNVPARAAAVGAPGTGSSTSQDETIETSYAVSRVIQEFEDRFGSIERLTVAALVDLQGTGAGAPSLTLADAQEIIKQAVGFKTTRDDIKVSDVRLPGLLPTAEEQAELERIRFWETVVKLVRNGSLAVAALVALILGWMLLRRLQPPPPPPPPEVPERVRLQERLTVMAQTNPEVLAEVLASMLRREEQRP